MNKMILSLIGSMAIFTATLGFQAIISATLSWGSIFTAVVASSVVNYFIVKVLIHKGVFYKHSLYPIAFYNSVFVLLSGVIVIISSGQSYVLDAFDLLSPYITIGIISIFHGLIMAIIISQHRKLV
ncbi:MAG: hypothetical protein ACQET6_06450 [Bacillota bacterium]